MILVYRNSDLLRRMSAPCHNFIGVFTHHGWSSNLHFKVGELDRVGEHFDFADPEVIDIHDRFAVFDLRPITSPMVLTAPLGTPSAMVA